MSWEAAGVVVAVGALVASAGGAAVAWWQAIEASRSKGKADEALANAREANETAKKHAASAKRGARAAEDAAIASGRQADAAQSHSNAAGRQANAAEASLAQVERHRIQDRRAEAIVLLTQMLYNEVGFASTLEQFRQRAFLRFSNGDSLIRAYALLDKNEHPVARWVARRRDEIAREIDLSQGEIASDQVGDHRSRASRLAAEAVSEMLDWLRGERTTDSFLEQNPPDSAA